VTGPGAHRRTNSDVGELCRYDVETAAPPRIDTRDVVLTSTDRLVVKGRTSSRSRTSRTSYLRLDRDATSARLLAEVPTDLDLVFASGGIAEGRLLLVDSRFEEEAPSPDSKVLARSFRP
jgi:Cu-Zn family superoxide dismutase